MSRVKKAEGAEFAGLCYICGGAFYVGEIIVRSELSGNPVAAHLECDAKIQDYEGAE